MFVAQKARVNRHYIIIWVEPKYRIKSMLYGMCNLQRKKEQNTFKNEIQLQQCNNPAGKMQTTMDDDDDDSIIIVKMV